MQNVNRNILFVDDEASILESFERMLHSECKDWVLHFASNVEDAMENVARHSVDVVVTDVKMPGKDGFDLLRLLKGDRETSPVPTIVVTGASEPTLKQRALDLGAADLLNKPVCREELVARIRGALRLKSYEERLELQVDSLEKAVQERTVQLDESRREIIWRLAKASEFRDDESGNHVVRVACYSRAIAEAMEKDSSFVDALFLASALHDVGKIGISGSILLKQNPLTDYERQEMQKHCLIGEEILVNEPLAMSVCYSRGYTRHQTDQRSQKDPLLSMAAAIAKCHHEKWDGSGYPNGLAQEDIPIEARIVALADDWDTLTTDRRNKPAFSQEKAWEIVREDAGRHFDPLVVAAFERKLTDVRAIHAEFREAEACWSPWEG